MTPRELAAEALGDPSQLDASRVTIRQASSSDAHACGRVIHDAFAAINQRHGYQSRWPSASYAAGFAGRLIANPGFKAIVAESDGEVIGCNFLDQRGSVSGVGPTAVSPAAQGNGVGRLLMDGVLRRNRGSVRLLQDAFNTASLALYASLGFELKEPIALVSVMAPKTPVPEAPPVRPIQDDDLTGCAQLCRRVHGFDRTRELTDAIRDPFRAPLLLERDGQIVAYSSGFGTFAHAVATTESDMGKLLLAARARHTDWPLECLIPIRHASLFGWALTQGFTITKTMNLMARGPYDEPRGSWCPSVLY